MKKVNLFKISILSTIILAFTSLSSCNKEEEFSSSEYLKSKYGFTEDKTTKANYPAVNFKSKEDVDNFMKSIDILLLEKGKEYVMTINNNYLKKAPMQAQLPEVVITGMSFTETTTGFGGIISAVFNATYNFTTGSYSNVVVNTYGIGSAVVQYNVIQEYDEIHQGKKSHRFKVKVSYGIDAGGVKLTANYTEVEYRIVKQNLNGTFVLQRLF